MLIVWVPTLSVAAHPSAQTSGYILPSPTAPTDPTVTALQKAQLAQQVEKLRHDNDWLWSSSPALLSTLAVIVAALLGVFRWLRET